MSSLIKISPVLMLLLFSGCGFKPVYSTTSGLSQQSPINAGIKIYVTSGGTTNTANNVTIDESANKSMVRQLVNNLEDMIPANSSPEYKLDVLVTQYSVGLGVARDGTASRYNMVINSTYKLIRIADGKEVDSGTVSTVNSYNNPNNQYFSTYVSEQDARKRGITELSEIYRQRLIAFADKQHPPTPSLGTPPVIDENCPKVC